MKDLSMRTILIALALILAAVGGYAFKEFAVARDSPSAALAPRYRSTRRSRNT